MDVFSVSADSLFTRPDKSARMENLSTRALSAGLDQYMAKDYESAIATFKRAVSLAPTSDSALNAYDYMARSFNRQGDTDAAISTYTKALKIAPNRDDLHTQLGNIYTTNKDFDKALEQYKLAAKYNPSAANLYSLGQGYLGAEQYDNALQQFQLVQQKDSKSPYGYHGMGQTYAKQGNTDAAIDAFKQAINVKSDYLDAYSELGYVYQDSGETEQATEMVATLKSMSPDDTFLADTLNQYIYEHTKPKMTAAYVSTVYTPFLTSLGPKTRVDSISSYLADPGSQRTFAMVFQFDKPMETSSVESVYNWSIARTTGTGRGDGYNYDMQLPTTEVAVPSTPRAVYYDAKEQTATVLFDLTQNATGDGTIDPSHIAFNFKGKDVVGLAMDEKADQYTGFSGFA